MSAGRSSFRKIPPARDGWFPATPTHTPISRSAAMAGRAYLYGLGAAGEAGVQQVLEWFHADIVRVMSLLGAERVKDLNRSLIEPPSS